MGSGLCPYSNYQFPLFFSHYVNLVGRPILLKSGCEEMSCSFRDSVQPKERDGVIFLWWFGEWHLVFTSFFFNMEQPQGKWNYKSLVHALGWYGVMKRAWIWDLSHRSTLALDECEALDESFYLHLWLENQKKNPNNHGIIVRIK